MQQCGLVRDHSRWSDPYHELLACKRLPNCNKWHPAWLGMPDLGSHWASIYAITNCAPRDSSEHFSNETIFIRLTRVPDK
mmetsp:Transcript_9659/g.18195  ORF Transcript_9659/g.18195 Transcript_9659/m.18195 type:complete len:80 (-) Transcript_9659:336-575(-)